jgi:alpha-L-fucosidase
MGMENYETNLAEFRSARLGLFVHLGLYSLLGRGEWALNRERIPLAEYRALADQFDPVDFDADALAALARRAGAKYLVFTTMHHDGFALYDSAVNPFNSVRLGPGRDLVREIVDACRTQGLRVHLYHSLNNWTLDPDGATALEDAKARERFVNHAHQRIAELLERFNPIDCLWYDGWWPFDAVRWRAEEMNALARRIQPHLLCNGRNGLPGDFATPETHLTAPLPWRPWEACMPHNRHWGFHAGDTDFKSTATMIDMLSQVTTGAGNLLINVGPDGRGRLPEPSEQLLEDLGRWTSAFGEAIYGSEPFGFTLRERDEQRGDFFHHGRYSARGKTLYLHLLSWPGREFCFANLQCKALSARLLHDDRPISLCQQGGRVSVSALPDRPTLPWGGVVAIDCDAEPAVYHTGGMHIPSAPHPRYDPCQSDLPH